MGSTRVPGISNGSVLRGFGLWNLWFDAARCSPTHVSWLGFGFWVLGSGFRVSGFGFWFLVFGFWVLGFGFWVLSFKFWVLGLGLGF